MSFILTPPRRYDPELLEDPHVDADLITRSLADVERANTFLGGAWAAIAELERSFDRLPQRATLLDVGTGAGDLPPRAKRSARKRGITLDTIGLDADDSLSRGAQGRVTFVVRADALALPFADSSVDIVMCSQVLHHFRGDAARTLVREMNRVARRAVVVSDLRRSWVAVAGIWLMSYVLRFHPVSRHDGMVSVMRGFTPHELASTVGDAVGVQPPVHQRIGYRITTSWVPI